MCLLRFKGITQRARVLAFSLLSFFLTQMCYAESGRSDYDLDDDGLIEINDLDDLNEMRNSALGNQLYGVNTGCPMDGCVGYELTANLDFDTNGNGQFDSGDLYWNDGLGWSPIANFRGTFNGNGFEIANLTINRASENYLGLFNRLTSAQVENLTLSQVDVFGSGYVAGLVASADGVTIGNVSVNGRVYATNDYAAAIAADIKNSTTVADAQVKAALTGRNVVGTVAASMNTSTITRFIVHADVIGNDSVGGVVGQSSSSTVSGSSVMHGQFNGSVTARKDVGGLIGRSHSNTNITGVAVAASVQAYEYAGGISGYGSTGTHASNVFATGAVSGDRSLGGLFGYLNASSIRYSYAQVLVSGDATVGGVLGSAVNSTIENVYWAKDVSGQTSGNTQNESNSYVGLTSQILKCAVQANTTWQNSSCVSETGADESLTGPVTLYRQWDTQSYLDAQSNTVNYWQFGSNTQLPSLNLPTGVASDADGDGFTDDLDAWDDDPRVGPDADADGYPDQWSVLCDSACQASSGFTLDHLPNVAAAHVDADWDGLPDAWSPGCDSQCQSDSGLVLDTAPDDTDNDGQTNDVDTDDEGDGQPDVDADSDGLIDISTLEQLRNIKFALNGLGYRTSLNERLNQSGCPKRKLNGRLQQACQGYELTNDLDLDTNGDGVFGTGDEDWNDGAGWLPLGTLNEHFQSLFDGNGHTIRNFKIQRDSQNQGLFAYTYGATIRNLRLYADLSVRANSGALIASAIKSQIVRVSVHGQVAGTGNALGGVVGIGNRLTLEGVAMHGSIMSSNGDSIGGLVGTMTKSSIRAAYATGLVSGYTNVAGLAGFATGVGQITASYAHNRVEASSTAGGVIAQSNTEPSVTNTYWVADYSGQSSSYGASEANSVVALNSSVLKCATMANTSHANSSCVSADGAAEGLSGPVTLYRNWDEVGYTDANSQFQPYWLFGTNGELPKLNFAHASGDRDGDGVDDSQDAWSDNMAIALDGDADGYPDAWAPICDNACQAQSGQQLDQFPSSAAAFLDADFDGLPDSWHPSCDAQCQLDSGLTLDAYPNDADNDGISDAVDNDDNGDGNIDADADSDGLIDVSSLAQLDAMRFQMDGVGRRNAADGELDSSGCPFVLYQGQYQRRCHGYELTTGLNFDTNSNGQFDSGDSYWNAGSGWQPIGNYSASFAAQFEGNGFTIANLVIQRPTLDNTGLFGRLQSAVVQNLHLSQVNIAGNSYTAGLAGYAKSSTIKRVGISGKVQGNSNTAGVLGGVENSTLEGAFSAASVVATWGYSVAGLAGSSSGNVTMSSVVHTGYVKGNDYVGGLVGSHGSGMLTLRQGLSSALVQAFGVSVGAVVGSVNSSQLDAQSVYWASDLAGVISQADEANSYVGVTAAALRCAVMADTSHSNSDCVSADGAAEGLDGPVTLYLGWGDQTYVDAQGATQAYWLFGSADQLPALNINNSVQRDGDGDGVLDSQDRFASQLAAATDNDNDGYPDSWSLACDHQCQQDSGLLLDHLPNHVAAYLDADLDGMPEAWAAACDSQCQQDSGLTLDPYPLDFDNDGISDLLDSDVDGDGNPDADGNSNGLVDIHTLAQLDAMRYALDGAGYKASSDATLDASGCPAMVHQGQYQRRCRGYELLADLDFDTDGSGSVDAGDTYWNGGVGWTAVGMNSDAPFAAEFHGNGFQIENLMTNSTDLSNRGLFGYLNQAWIHDLKLQGSLRLRNQVGLLAGVARNSQLDRIEVTGQIAANQWVGGVVGISWATQFNDVQADVTLTCHSDYGFVCKDFGGLVGEATNTQVVKAHTQATITAEGEMGGLIGYSTSSEILFSSSHSTLNAPNHNYVGGLVGRMKASRITSSYAKTDIQAGQYAGGLVGQLNSEQSAAPSKIEYSFATGSVQTQNYAGGIVGYIKHGQHQILGSLARVSVTGTNKGGLVAYLETNNLIENSYWANNAEGATASWGAPNADNGYLGVHQKTLSCASSAGQMTNGESCTSGAYMVFRQWDQGGFTNSQGHFVPYWDLTQEALPVLTQIPLARQDSDGDGVVNADDAAPFDFDNDGSNDSVDQFMLISLDGRTDTDGDGAPDECDVSCLATGMTEDLDDDNDGYPDDVDAFDQDPTEWIDTDNDGIGNNADPDDDNDLVLDSHDYYPTIPLGDRLDTDGNGRPDDCDDECLAAGMTADPDDDGDGHNDEVDLFPRDASEWADFDGDGVGDNADTDDDNDGVEDHLDPVLGEDNGLPTLLPLDLAERHISVSTDNGQQAVTHFDQAYFDAMGASDVYDTQVDIEARVDGTLVSLVAGNLTLNAGRRVVNWYAVDSAGNRSTPLSQIVNVYPRVGFASATSVTGEPSTAKVTVRLTGDSPVYPVQVTLIASQLSDATQADFESSFDLSAEHQVTIAAGTEAALNRDGHLQVPVVADDVAENDELLILTLQSVDVGGDTAQWFALQAQQTEHSLTLTDRNLPPVVALRVTQGGQETLVVDQQGGMVTVVADIEDPNGLDQHSVVWLSGDLTHTTPAGNKLTFDPANIAAGEYKLTVQVTDNGVAPEMVEQSVLITVQGSAEPSPDPSPEPSPETPKPPAKSSGGGGGGGGGPLMPWLLLSLLWCSRRFAR